MRRTSAVIVAAALVLVASASLAGAGLNPIITGVATCNTATGQYDVVWTLSDVLSAGPFDIDNPADVTATPGGAVSNVTFSPATVPQDGDATASGSLPGTTTSAHIFVFANGAPRNFDIDGSDGLLGTCTTAAGGDGTSGDAASAIVAAPTSTG